jgi:hypothetical protein
VVCRESDVVDVTRSNAFLARRGFREFEWPNSKELIFELVHSGRSK